MNHLVRFRGVRLFRSIAVAAVWAGVLLATSVAAQTAVVTVTGTVSPLVAGATDAGQVAASQKISGIVLQLKTTAAQQESAAIYALTGGLTSGTSGHQWLTPQQYADQFGATADQVGALTAWLTAQGLSVDYVAAGRGFVVVSGTAAQVEAALGVQIENFELASGATGWANVGDPVLPAGVGALVANIRGLNSFSAAKTLSPMMAMTTDYSGVLDAGSAAQQGIAGAGVAVGLAGVAEQTATLAVAPLAQASDASALSADPLLAAALAIDGNRSAVLHVGGGCAASMTADDMAWFQQMAVEAGAQGVTLVASTTDCTGGEAYPAALNEVTAVGRLSATVDATVYPVMQQGWQMQAGAPSDGLRHTPDVSVGTSATADDAAAVAGVLALVEQKAAARQGEVNSVLYSLAGEQGAFQQSGSGLTALAAVANGTGAYDALAGLGTPDASSLLTLWPMATGSGATTINVTPLNPSPTYGSGFSILVTVTSGTGGAIPTGTVTFYINSFISAPVTLNSGGLVTYSYSPSTPPAVGQYSVVVVYSGDSTNYAPNTSTTTVQVSQATPTVTATVNGTPSIGVPFTATIKVAGVAGGVAPTGTVTVDTTSFNGATASVVSQGNGTWLATVTPNSGGGPNSLTFNYNGDTNYVAGSYVLNVGSVTLGTTTTAVTYSPIPATAGQDTTLTATVTPSVGGNSVTAPSGTVYFSINGLIVSAQLTGNTATTTYQFAASSNNVLTANYGGDTNWKPSTSPAVSVSVGKMNSAITLTTSATSILYGNTLTLTADVAPAATLTTTQTPTGTVTFYNGGGPLATVALSSGEATYDVSTLNVGTAVITARYSGDSYFATSTSAPSSVGVSQDSGILEATIAPVTAPYGTQAVVTATLTLNGGGNPVGSITATVPGTVAAGGGTYTGTLTANTGGTSTANITVNLPPPGAYTINVACASANANFTCAPTTVDVSVTKGYTTTTVSVLPTTPLSGQKVQLTAVVANQGGGTGTYAYTGSIEFYDGGADLGGGAVVSNQVTISLAMKTGVSHAITAIYTGDTNWYGSTSNPVAVTVAANPSTTSLTSSLSTALVGTGVVLTANVGSTSGTVQVIPTGVVTFYDNYNGSVLTLGTGTLAASGPYAAIAVFSTTGLQGGAHSIFAIYGGDSNFNTSTSPTLAVTEQSYTLSINPAALTINRGSSGSATVTMGSTGGFVGTVTFGCTPPPDTLTTCTFLPSVVASSGTTVLTISTTTANSRGGITVAALVTRILLLPVAALPLLLLLPAGRNRLFHTGCANVTVNPNGSTGSGSGSGGSGSGGTGGTPTGTLSFTITTSGTSTSVGGSYVERQTINYMVTTQ